jgi:hypothetical protein
MTAGSLHAYPAKRKIPHGEAASIVVRPTPEAVAADLAQIRSLGASQILVFRSKARCHCEQRPFKPRSHPSPFPKNRVFPTEN